MIAATVAIQDFDHKYLAVYGINNSSWPTSFCALFLFIELNKHKRHNNLISLRWFVIRLNLLSASQPNLNNFNEFLSVLFKRLLGYFTEKTNKVLFSYSLYLVGSACIPYLFIFYSCLL